jgi:adenosine kinase
MLCERTGESLEAISRRPNIDGIVVTLADQGCDVWQRGQVTRVPGVPAESVVDPTGCGDAVRAGLLYGLEQRWPLARAAALGMRLGALKIAHRGGQNHRFERASMVA